MSETVIFNFGLLLEDSFADEAVRASQLLARTLKMDYVLGEDSLPHVTILQFPGRLADAANYWTRLQTGAMPEIRLHFHGLAFDRFRSLDGLWLRIKPCRELREVQESALAILGRDLEYVNGLGSFYEPHATLAAWPKSDRLPAFEIPEAVLSRKDVPTYYSLGISGPNFQYHRCLHIRR